MGLSSSKPEPKIGHAKIKSRHLSKKELRTNMNSILNNKMLNNTDMASTLDWLTTTSIGFVSATQDGGNLSDNANLQKLNDFIKSLDSDSLNSVNQNFDIYQNEIKNLEGYINQNGGYDKFNNKPLNIVYSEYLFKVKGGAKNENETEVSTLNYSDFNTEELEEDKGELDELSKYINQTGGFDKFEGMILNKVNSTVLKRLERDLNKTQNTETISSLNMSDLTQNGGCPCNDNTTFIGGAKKKKYSKKYTNNTLSATSTMIGGGSNINVSITSNSSAIMGTRNLNGGSLEGLSETSSLLSLNNMYGGNNADTISATSAMIGGGNIRLSNLSPTSNSSLNHNMKSGNADTISDTSIMIGGGNIRLSNLSPTSNSSRTNNTFSGTSVNSKLNTANLPRFSETSFSENVLNGGARNETRENKRRRKSESSSESEEDEIEMEEESTSESESESENILNNNEESTESSDDTVKMAKMIARQRENEKSSTTTESKDSSEEDEELDESEEEKNESETSDNDTSTESSDSRKDKRKNQMSRTKGKKGKKSSKKLISENSLTISTEFKAVPFYSSELSTDFYRTYKNKNRFN